MDEILVHLKKAILAYDTEAAGAFAKKTIEDGIDPLKAVNAAIEGIKEIGDRFGRGEAWLPDLCGVRSLWKPSGNTSRKS